MEIKYARTVLNEQDVIGAPWVIDDKDFLVLVREKNDWIWISAAILMADQIPSGEKRAEMFLECLRANHLLPEICFDADDEGNLGTSQELHSTGVNLEGGYPEFKYEFLAVPAAIKYFKQTVAPKFDIEVVGFRDMVEKFIEKIGD
ncbi:MAG: hypothetical protein ACTSU5_05490 [Promethearchaeota archaeon]